MPDKEPRQDDNPQDARAGGYGADTGAQPAEEQESQDGGGTSAAGRDEPIAGEIDGDEALGNRAGGYGRAPHGRKDHPDRA